MEHFFFDLDGTLLPMNQRRFVEFYMPLLAARFEHRGIPPEQLTGAVWKGVEAMAFNDGSCVNEEVFWDCFERQLSIRREEVEEEVLDFYANEFNQAIQSTEPTPVADQIIKFFPLTRSKNCLYLRGRAPYSLPPFSPNESFLPFRAGLTYPAPHNIHYAMPKRFLRFTFQSERFGKT